MGKPQRDLPFFGSFPLFGLRAERGTGRRRRRSLLETAAAAAGEAGKGGDSAGGSRWRLRRRLLRRRTPAALEGAEGGGAGESCWRLRRGGCGGGHRRQWRWAPAASGEAERAPCCDASGGTAPCRGDRNNRGVPEGPPEGMDPEEERLKLFLLQLRSESGILDRMIYKNKNQHRRCTYFQSLLKVRRDMRLLLSMGLEEILKSAFQVIHGKNPAQRVYLLER
ncbi:hypothetical protein Taro_015377 [Colocasia esculenta]|uniref:Nucleolus and neural progenitor protein-like N-terminal domain-containing protein n=1 Tax=Colocasia esculenta TaxID=4460 RepID=A0A843UBB3_COLES|nr:hypothetical protein [Colocasia esculenta]